MTEGSNGTVLVKCHGNCTAKEVVETVGLKMSDLFPRKSSPRRSTPQNRSAHVHTPSDSREKPPASGLTLAAYAQAIGCTREELSSYGLIDEKYGGAPAVRIPYLGTGGQEIARRWRVAMERGEDGVDQRFRHRSGDKLYLYGLWRLEQARKQDWIILVEGESDCHVLWTQGFPTLGVPGASSFRPEWATAHLGGFERVYVVHEDEAGAGLVEKVAESLGDRLYVMSMPDGHKDPRALYLDDKERFADGLRLAMEEAPAWAKLNREREDARRSELWETCSGLALEEDILGLLRTELGHLGVVGEENYALILYLALTSRLLNKPVSVAGKGPSAAGKSFVLERILETFPESAFYVLTAMSEHALAYSEEPLEHRMLVIFEAGGMESDFTSYLIRSLLSEGKIRYETVEKTTDGLKARLIEREGPTGLLITTTAIRLHPENETRILSVTTDDTSAQTARVLAATALGGESDDAPDMVQWQSLQEWLALGPRAVSIPYAEALAELIPPVAVRLRRDFAQVLSLIRSHALLHQATRQRDDQGRIVATFEDYAAIRSLAAPLIAEGVGATVSETVRETVKAVSDLLSEGVDSVSVALLAVKLKLDSSAASRRVRFAASKGFLTNLETKRRQRARYVVGDPLPEDVDLLPYPVELESVCTCADTPKGDNRPMPAGQPVSPETAGNGAGDLFEGVVVSTGSEDGAHGHTPSAHPGELESGTWEEVEVKP